jgi:hypothetical protein
VMNCPRRSQRAPLLDDDLAGGLPSDRDWRLSFTLSSLKPIAARNVRLDKPLGFP